MLGVRRTPAVHTDNRLAQLGEQLDLGARAGRAGRLALDDLERAPQPADRDPVRVASERPLGAHVQEAHRAERVAAFDQMQRDASRLP